MGFRPKVGCGAMPRPEHLAGQRLRRRPDKCDAGRRRHKLHITRFRRCRRRKLAHSAVPPLPAKTALLGFGGNPIQGGDKSSRKRKPLRLLGAASFAEEFSIYSRETSCLSIWVQRIFLLAHSVILAFLHGGGITTLSARFMPPKRWTPAGHGGSFAVFMPLRCSPCVG